MSLILLRPTETEMDDAAPVVPDVSGLSDAAGPRIPSDDSEFDATQAFDEHGSELLAFAVTALRDRPLAEDCVQETFLRAYRARSRFDATRASQRTWLFAIARNVITDAFRARGRLPRRDDSATLEDVPVHTIDPLERLRLVEALARLSEAHRQVVLAVHVRGASYQELAESSGVPVATLRTRAFHALRALRAHLEGSEGSDDVDR